MYDKENVYAAVSYISKKFGGQSMALSRVLMKANNGIAKFVGKVTDFEIARK